MKDQQFISFNYGNEDRMEGIELHNFESPEEAAKFLEQVAKNIRKYKNSKEYRSSKDSIFKDTILGD